MLKTNVLTVYLDLAFNRFCGCTVRWERALSRPASQFARTKQKQKSATAPLKVHHLVSGQEKRLWIQYLEIYEKEIEKYKKSISEKTKQITELQTQLGVSEYNTDNEDFLQFKSDIRSIINPSYDDEKTKEFNRLDKELTAGLDLASQLLEDEV